MEKNTYDLSSSCKTTADIGYIIPTYWQEVVPNGTYKIRPQLKVNFSSLVGPVYGLFKLKIRSYFVPMRLIWTDFEKHFATNDNTTYPVPYQAVNLNTVYGGTRSIWQHIGCGEATESYTKNLNALPLRAYDKIYYDHYYKSENVLAEDTFVKKTSGADTSNTLIKCDFYESDYLSERMASQFYSSTPTLDGSTTPFNLQDIQSLIAKSKQKALMQKYIHKAQDLINDLFQINTESGTTSKLLYSNDEFFTFNNITNVAASSNYPLGIQQSLVSTNSDGTFDFNSKEFGYIMTLASIIPVMPNIGGTQDELFAPEDGYFFYNPNFATMGMVPIKNRALCNNAATWNEMVAGYLPIYERYRHGKHLLTGQFMTTYKDLVVHKSLTDASGREILADNYDYLFTSFTQPQVRIFDVHQVQAMLPIPKVLNPAIPTGNL